MLHLCETTGIFPPKLSLITMMMTNLNTNDTGDVTVEQLPVEMSQIFLIVIAPCGGVEVHSDVSSRSKVASPWKLTS